MKGKLRLPLLASALAAITLGISVSVASANDGAVVEKASYNSLRQSKATIAARQKWFGLDNVNPITGSVRNDRVIMSWAGISTFAASFSGHVVLLDGSLAYGPRGTWGSNEGYLGSNVQEYATLNPELYLFGHGHADHMGLLTQILAVLPTLQLYGVEEHCNDIRTILGAIPVNCTSILHAGAQFGEQATIPVNLIPGVDVRAVKHPHSAAPTDKVNNPAFDTEQVTPHDCVSYDTYPPTGAEPSQIGGPTSGVLSLSWQFHIQGTNFSLGWADTTGDIANHVVVTGLGDGNNVPPVYATWPHTNVFFGSIAVGPRETLNQQINVIEPQLYIPIHHDPCTFDIKSEFDQQLATLPKALQPAVWWLTDPGDYHRPLVFDPTSPVWD